MSGIGFILISIQLPALLGFASPPGGVLGSLQALPGLALRANLGELALGVLALAILFLMPRAWRRFVPPQLLALVLGTLAALWLLGGGSYRAIGEIPTGLPSIQLPTFNADQWRTILIDALVLGMLGSIDALLTFVIADSLTRTQHDSDKELVGQGLGNLASGLFGGLPGAGATMGTVVNIQSGARTAVSGLTRALILAVVVFGAGHLVEDIPKAVLAGIAIKVGIDIIDWGFLRRAHRVSLRGSVIFGAASALSRQQTRLGDARFLVVDLAQVPHLGVTTSLALEGIVRESAQRGCPVYLAGLQDQPRERCERLGLANLVPAERWTRSRADALRRVAEGPIPLAPLGSG